MSNRLETLLNNAKQQNPLLTQSDVSAIISNKNLLVKKQSFFTLKNILMMSVVCAVIAGLWLGFYPTPTQNNNSILVKESVVNKQEAIAEPTIKTNQPKENKKVDLTIKQSPLAVNKKPKPTKEFTNKQEAPLFEPFNSTPKFSETNNEDNRTYFDENGYLILTNEELVKLGIITDGNVLKYENITDTIIDVLENGVLEKKHTFFSVNIHKYGSLGIDHSFQNDTDLVNQSLNFWPAFLTTQSNPIHKKYENKKDSSTEIIEWLFGYGNESEFQKEISPFLVPVYVSLKSIPDKLSSDYKLIFWFKSEPLFYQALGRDIALAVIQKYGSSTTEQFKTILNKYRNLSRNGAFSFGFDSLTVTKMQKRYTQLDNDQLKKLNIFKKSNGYVYKSFKNLDNKTKVLKVTVSNSDANILENYKFIDIFKKANPDLIAVASTDLNLKNFIYLKLYSDTISFLLKMDLEEKYFRENINKLIPIKVDSSYVIWFEPTEKLKRIMKIEDQNESRKIDLTKVKLIEYNEKELLNLGIKFENNGILVPMFSYFPVHDNWGLISSLFRKTNGIDTKFDTFYFTGKPERFKKYPAPKITTDIYGSKFLSLKEGSINSGSVTSHIDSNFKFNLNSLLPLKITSGNVSIIAWYEPDSLFLSSLPNTQATEIKNDLEAISTNQPTLSCKYFEACQNVSGKINSYLAYPNPAEQTLNIEIDLAEERNLEFIITDITGKIIKTLNQNLNQAKGKQTYTYQIGELTEGMYLLIITTNKGEKVSTRIVKR